MNEPPPHKRPPNLFCQRAEFTGSTASQHLLALPKSQKPGVPPQVAKKLASLLDAAPRAGPASPCGAS
eukprot:5125330-Amphidinium_carterae.1